jgi:hypothetical protein
MESLFNITYLLGVVTIGIIMIKKSAGNKEHLLFGIMAVVLGAGDAFHLIPRTIALLTTGLENYTVMLGIGKMITSITMTVFYLLLYYVWRIRYKISGREKLTIAFYGLSLIRIVLCLMPQNMWTSLDAPLDWAIYRNIPFAFIGLIIIVLFYLEAKKTDDKAFRYMWLTIVLSFAFYTPVVLWVDVIPLLGMLMIPKTIAYVWTILIGYSDLKNAVKG